MLADACAMHMIRRPTDFDVLVAENLFGDVLTDGPRCSRARSG